MILNLNSLVLCGVALAPLVVAQVDPLLTGTWTTKSRKVFTGPVCTLLESPPYDESLSIKGIMGWIIMGFRLMQSQGFYDPVNEKMFEPPLTGFSYSFTDDGFYEVAYYRAGSNRT